MKRQPKLEFYQDRKGEWRWQAVAANGRVLSCSSEGYTRRSYAEHCAKLTVDAILHAGMEPVPPPAIASNAIN